MKLTLTRKQFREDGIFSVLTREDGTVVAQTLEHSYDNKPKLYDGTFICRRGKHRLEGMTHDFETFEITEVKNHTGILFHTGNYNEDSNGCCLLGSAISTSNGKQIIIDSRRAFQSFLDLLMGLDSFTLVVK